MKQELERILSCRRPAQEARDRRQSSAHAGAQQESSCRAHHGNCTTTGSNINTTETSANLETLDSFSWFAHIKVLWFAQHVLRHCVPRIHFHFLEAIYASKSKPGEMESFASQINIFNTHNNEPRHHYQQYIISNNRTRRSHTTASQHLAQSHNAQPDSSYI